MLDDEEGMKRDVPLSGEMTLVMTTSVSIGAFKTPMNPFPLSPDANITFLANHSTPPVRAIPPAPLPEEEGNR